MHALGSSHSRTLMFNAGLLAAAACAVLLSGCGRSNEAGIAPVACLAGPNAYLTALDAAPNEVELNDGTKISDCLVPRQSGGELATIGADLVAAATTANGNAIDDPAGPWSVRVGYLLGAVEKAAWSSNGIHTDLVRRVSAAAGYVPQGDDTELLQPGFDRGLEAGRTRG